MKTTLIALATVLGLSTGAFAMDASDKGGANAPQTDTVVTSSIKKATHSLSVPANDDGYATKAGIDVTPNFLPHS